MGFIKVLITIILLFASLFGVLLFSFKYVTENPFGNAHQHELTYVEATNPTCDKAGYRAHYFCKGCEGFFADENGYAPLSVEEATIAPLGHDFENLSCAGVKKCEFCGKIEGVGSSHTPGITVKETVKNATCNAEGEYYNILMCEVCGQEVSRELAKSPATSIHVNDNDDEQCDICGAAVCKTHTPVVDAAVPATCTTEGLTEGSHCGVCNTAIVAQQIIPPSHSIKFNAKGMLTVNADGSYNTSNLVVSIGCVACEFYPSEMITDYSISADKPFENGGVITYGDYKFEFPALDTAKYDLSSTYDGNDQTPIVTTAFTLKGTEFAYGVTSNNCIDLLGDGTVYSIYELDKLNNENVVVTYDAENGYLYSSKQNHTIPYIIAYGANITVTGDVHVLAEKRINVNTHLIIGTDSAAANVRIERAAAASAENEVITLWRGADLTIKNGTLTTVGKASANWAVDIRIAKESDVNPTSDCLILIEKNGNFVTEGTGEYCIFIEQVSKGRLVVDGTITSNRSIVAASEFAFGDEFEYGFEPAFYIRHGNVNITGTTMPFCVSSIQVGSEKENASGTFTVVTNCDVFRMGRNKIAYTFAKGTLNFESTSNDKTILQTAGDGSGTAYFPYTQSGYVEGDIDFKKDMVVNAKVLKGSKNNYFFGIWKAGAKFVQNWMVEEGATFNLTDVQLFYRINKDNNVKFIAYKEAELNIDGAVKTVRVGAKLVGTTTAANTPANMVFATFDTAAVWTTDTATAAVNGWLKATDANGNTIYYK